MRYWDASALVPLVVDEASTDLVRGWLGDDLEIVTWAWTSVELASAVERRVRDGVFTRPQRRQLLDAFGRLARSWDDVTDVVSVRYRAISLLARHPLRAADAAQLGAALVVAGDQPGLPFVCLDERLALAAEQEGLAVLSG
ncbi:MAG: type II toxin-antitoxin system VapC family toxin [Acidimicrobiia bacterium]|nr:type II toxin-antitoxin system VapC family toxin [Acidimicrobiia bacterium]